MAQFDLKKALVKIYDGTPTTPNNIEIKVGEGTLNFTEHRPIQYMRDRGKLSTTRDGDEEPVDVRLDAIWEYIKSGQAGTEISISDALRKKNGAAGWISADTVDPCAPYATDIHIHYNPQCTGIQGEITILPEFRYEQLEYDAKAGTINVTGKCNATMATSTRTSASSV